MIIANKKDYRKGYKKHYALYKRLQNANSDVNSRRLLLIYCVECGLKYLLLTKWREENPRKIVESTDEKKKNILGTHSLEILLKELGQQGIFKFPPLKTTHGDLAASGTYHQLYRYCIQLQEKDKLKEKT